MAQLTTALETSEGHGDAESGVQVDRGNEDSDRVVLTAMPVATTMTGIKGGNRDGGDGDRSDHDGGDHDCGEIVLCPWGHGKHFYPDKICGIRVMASSACARPKSCGQRQHAYAPANVQVRC